MGEATIRNQIDWFNLVIDAIGVPKLRSAAARLKERLPNAIIERWSL